MTNWISESDFRQSKASSLGIGLNLAFVHDIKQDNVEFRTLLEDACVKVIAAPAHAQREETARELSDLLNRLRDELETYFALEEFYGGYNAGEGSDVNREAIELKDEHIELFLELGEIVESVEQVVYHELPTEELANVAKSFKTFQMNLQKHEQKEMELVMRQCNEELGSGD